MKENQPMGLFHNQSEKFPQRRALWNRMVSLLGGLLCLNLLFGGIFLILLINSVSTNPQGFQQGEISTILHQLSGDLRWSSIINNRAVLVSIFCLAAFLVLYLLVCWQKIDVVDF
jgi:hypothetical protein